MKITTNPAVEAPFDLLAADLNNHTLYQMHGEPDGIKFCVKSGTHIFVFSGHEMTWLHINWTNDACRFRAAPNGTSITLQN